MNEPISRITTAKNALKRVFGSMPLFALRRFTVTVLLLVTFSAVSEAQSAFTSTSLLHKQAPKFARTDLNHKRVDLKAYRGKVVMLNFWATWCAPCQVEIPTFVVWQKKYSGQGLQIIGISMDDDPALVRAAYRKLNLNYPVAMGDVKIGDLYGGVLGLPITFLIDRHGEIQAEFQGETDLNKIEAQLQSLLPRR